MALGQMAFRRERRSLRLPGPRAQPSAAALLTPKNPFCHFIILNLKWYKTAVLADANGKLRRHPLSQISAKSKRGNQRREQNLRFGSNLVSGLPNLLK